jgi:hypothetical protein
MENLFWICLCLFLPPGSPDSFILTASNPRTYKHLLDDNNIRAMGLAGIRIKACTLFIILRAKHACYYHSSRKACMLLSFFAQSMHSIIIPRAKPHAHTFSQGSFVIMTPAFSVIFATLAAKHARYCQRLWNGKNYQLHMLTYACLA